MKHRMTLGFRADAAETAAMTMVDPYATDRIIDACDWIHCEEKRKRLIDNAMRRLSPRDRVFARRVLKGHRWQEMGVSRQAFYCKLKKICDVLERPANRGRKRLSDISVNTHFR